MNIPNYENAPVTSNGQYLSDAWSLILQQLILTLQNNVGQEGFVISQVSSDPNSVAPPTAGGQVAKLAATFGTQGGAQLGTLIFDPFEVNGGGGGNRNGQLKVLLNDGTFHAITNS